MLLESAPLDSLLCHDIAGCEEDLGGMSVNALQLCSSISQDTTLISAKETTYRSCGSLRQQRCCLQLHLVPAYTISKKYFEFHTLQCDTPSERHIDDDITIFPVYISERKRERRRCGLEAFDTHTHPFAQVTWCWSVRSVGLGRELDSRELERRRRCVCRPRGRDVNA